MTRDAPLKRHYAGLFFTGISLVLVLLPFPNIFGILLDMTILAIALPLTGKRAMAALVYIYNFNPIKLNGVLGLYYVIYALANALIAVPAGWNKQYLIAASVISFMLLASFLEYLVVAVLSKALWNILGARDPRLRAIALRQDE